MKIAFEIAGGDTWQAGVAYIDSFIRALKQTYRDEVLLYCMSPTTDTYDDLGQEKGEVLRISANQKWTPIWVVEQVTKCLFGYNLIRQRVLKRHKIDAVFGFVLSHRYGSIPTLSWIPDFQHLHLPEMFSASERHKRNWIFLRTAKISSRIILMSQAVKRDFETFVPQYAGKARVLIAVSYVPESIYEADPKTILNFYHLPEKFIYLPNQFWKHKNHELVFQALRIMREKGMRVFVVCTGYQGDYRHPHYFRDLLQRISSWGVRDQIALLGLIPRHHMFLLMRMAICVLNPSLFEGFGLTVDEARSMGKRVLLSDIAVHREQNPPEATYFDPYNRQDLVDKLSTIWREMAPGPDAKLEFEARQSLGGRLRACAESFMSVTREVHRG